MTRSLTIWLLAAVLCAGFLALGTWQVERRAWKLGLIARVEARVQAEPVAAPGHEDWAAIGRERDEYRHLRLEGRYDEAARETLVQAVTARGPGWWVLTPFALTDGMTVLVNRGFVDAAHRDPASRATTNGEAARIVTGLLRISEPHGGFLRANDPAANRWYSRDVAAIGAALGVPAARLAPYFVDADASADASAWPIGGMTVVRFHNSHLVYAATWYTLALMSLAGGCIATRQKSRS